MKRYVMTTEPGQAAPPALLDAATSQAGKVLAGVDDGHGVGFVLVHVARPAYFVLVDWWVDVDLRQRYFRAEHDRPDRLQELPLGAIGCVWELEVVLHERDAWIAHVLAPEEPNYDGYLQDVYRYPRR